MGKISNIRYKAIAPQALILPPVKTPQGASAGICGDGVLYLVFFALPTGLESLREQGAQHTHDYPEHTGSQQDEHEQEHQHKSGRNEKLNHSYYLVVFVDAGAGIEPAAPDNETGMLPLHHPAGFKEC